MYACFYSIELSRGPRVTRLTRHVPVPNNVNPSDINKKQTTFFDCYRQGLSDFCLYKQVTQLKQFNCELQLQRVHNLHLGKAFVQNLKYN